MNRLKRREALSRLFCSASESSGSSMNKDGGAETLCSGEKNGGIRKRFKDLLPGNLEERIRNEFCRPQFYPPFSDREAWEKLFRTPEKKQMAQRILMDTEVILSEDIPPLPVMDYIAYRLRGNRTDYEAGYFRRRSNLGRLSLALCLTGDTEKYLPPLVNHLWAIVNERYWCIHAHAFYQEKDVLPPDADTQTRLDLFSASTASLVADVMNITGSEIEHLSPNMAELFRQETIRKTLRPFLNHEYETPYFWQNGQGNWSIWISESLLNAGLLLLEDPEDLVRLIDELNGIADRYYDFSFDDGFCDEGPGYWIKSAAEFFRYADHLEKAFPGSMEKLYAEPKFRAMLEFPARVRMAPDRLLNFSDGGSRIKLPLPLLAAAAKATGSELLLQFARQQFSLAQQDEHAAIPLPPYRMQAKTRIHLDTGDFFQQTAEFFFTPRPWEEDTSANSSSFPGSAPKSIPENESTFYPGRLGIVRGGKEGFCASLKGGHNGEMHNHNDLGHFTLFHGRTPVVIDLGTDVYTAKTFSGKRYESLYHGAQGHNAPFFSGIGETAGKSFSASLEFRKLEDGSQSLSSDLLHAYPGEAGLQSFRRTLSLSPDGKVCTISDRFSVNASTSPELLITLFTPVPVSVMDKILLFDGQIRLDASSFDSVELAPFVHNDANIRKSWGDQLTRIRLTLLAGNSGACSLVFSLPGGAAEDSSPSSRKLPQPPPASA